MALQIPYPRKAIISSVGSAAEGGTTQSSRPIIIGTADAGTIVLVFDSVRLIGSATADVNGNWSFAPTIDMKTGAHQITAIATDSVQGYGASSEPLHVTVAPSLVVLPPAPVITNMYDFDNDLNPVGYSLPSGSVIAYSLVNLSGDGIAGDVIKIYDGATLLGSATVRSNGRWIFAIDPLKDGTYHLSATQTNAAGSESLHSNSMVVTIDTTVPPAPQVNALIDLSGQPVSTGGHTDSAHPAFSGTGVAGDTVTLYEGSTVIGSATVSAGGTWSVTPDKTWTVGTHDLHAIQTNLAGTHGATSNTFEFVMNAVVNLGAPVIEFFSQYDVNHVYVNEIVSGSESAYQNFQIEGKGVDAGSIIQVYDNSTLLGTAVALSTGTWSFFVGALSNGAHDFSVTQKLAGGAESSSSNHVGVTVVHTGPMAPVADHVTQYATADGQGINRNHWDVPPPPLTPYLNFYGRGEPAAVVHIFDGSTQIGSSLVNKVGRWQFIAPDFAIGAHDISMTQTTPDHLESPSTTHYYMTVQNFLSTGSVTSGIALADSRTDDWAGVDVLDSIVVTSEPAVSIIGGATRMALSTTTETTSAAAADNSPLTSTTVQHSTVGAHDVFVGTVGVSHTVDLTVDPSLYLKESTAHIEGSKGGAVDTLHLTGDHQVLDLTSHTGQTSAAKISGIASIDLGGHVNSLKLSLVDVLNLGEANLFLQDAKQQMMVNGSNGDTVNLSNSHVAGVADGEWDATGSEQIGGVMYNVYEHSGAHVELMVKQGVLVELHN